MGAGGRDGRTLRVAIIGAGPGGLCTGKRLLDEGFDDFVILERTDEVGGTWNLNRYPGCECDVPSALYSFSFEPKLDWSKPYGTQPEILDYLRHVAGRHGLLAHCRFGDGVARAEWDEAATSWTLTLESGERLEADVVVSAIGMFNDIHVPDIEGLDDFAGTMFHSARWPRDHDLTDERVAVIGSAASAVQLVPEVRKVAAQVHLFQRTANWVMPKIDTPFTQEQLDAFRDDPSLMLAFRGFVETNVNKGMTFSDPTVTAESERAVLAALEVVEDPEIRRKLVPDHPFGCKRPLLSNDYYRAFNEPNLELVTEPIERVTADSVITVDGVERTVDTIVLATGFATTKYLAAIDVVGRDGKHIVDAWNEGAEAYLGITTPGFPNLFMLYGPNTNNGSIITMIEYQVEHVLAHVRRLAGDDVAWVEVRPEAVERFNAEVQEGIAGVKPWNAGCNGYYRTASGRVVTQWPWSMEEFARRSAEIDPDAFEMGARA
jgi:cation diffusion facilitator CzcD-associated flavoprotein CzcO